MSTVIKRLKQSGKEFVPITVSEAVVVNTARIDGIVNIGITTLDKVLKETFNLVEDNAEDIKKLDDSVSTINVQLSKKQDKLKAGDGIAISNTGVISCTTTGFSYKIVTSLPVANASNENIVFLLASSKGVTGNLFTEHICVKNNGTYVWEQIGEIQTEVDLSNYVTKDTFEALASKVITADGNTLYKNKNILLPITKAENVQVTSGNSIITLDKVLAKKIDTVKTDTDLVVTQDGSTIILAHSNKIAASDTVKPLMFSHDSFGHVTGTKTFGASMVQVNGEVLTAYNGSNNTVTKLDDNFKIQDEKISINWNNI